MKGIDRAVFPGAQGGPLEHSIAGKAVAFGEALKPQFKTYAQNVVKNCAALGEGLAKQGLKLIAELIGRTLKHRTDEGEIGSLQQSHLRLLVALRPQAPPGRPRVYEHS